MIASEFIRTEGLMIAGLIRAKQIYSPWAEHRQMESNGKKTKGKNKNHQLNKNRQELVEASVNYKHY
jgi:hypothetical protein